LVKIRSPDRKISFSCIKELHHAVSTLLQLPGFTTFKMATTVTPSTPLTRNPDLNSRSILITGGASGLGLAAVHALATSGAYITVATNIAIPGNILSSLQSSGAHIQEVTCDVSDWDSVHDAFKKAISFSPTGTLDVVAMFAGIDKQGHLADQIQALGADDEPQRPSTAEIDVNLKGTLYTTSLALHYFRANSDKDTPPRDKSLIFVSSLAGYIDDTHNSVYTASKFGVRGLWRSIRAKADAEMGIRCNLIAPWAIKTPMTEPILRMLDQLGIKDGEGITFAKEETVVQAVMKCIGDTSISGELEKN
jgi:5'-hydroxyaverantin dehydrogenase